MFSHNNELGKMPSAFCLMRGGSRSLGKINFINFATPMEIPTQEKIKVPDNFEEKLFSVNEEDVKSLKTIIIWIFQSTTDPNDKQYFIKNNLFNSNNREKIRGALNNFSFAEEIDTGIELAYDDKGDLTFDSTMKLYEKQKECDSAYSGKLA